MTMTARQWLNKNCKGYERMSWTEKADLKARCAKAVGCKIKNVDNVLTEIRRANGVASPNVDVDQKGKTLSDFRVAYDKSFIVPKRIKEALKELGKNGWEYEVPFAKIAGLSLTDLGNYRDQFIDFVIQIPGGRRAWAGSRATAIEMRKML